MKKSDIYKAAQCAVLTHTGMKETTKLEILRELMDKEDLALFTEKQEEGSAE